MNVLRYLTTQPHSKTLTLALTICLISGMLCGKSWAQDDQEIDSQLYRGTYTIEELKDEAHDLASLIENYIYASVNTPQGCTVEQFVEAVQEQSPIHLNIIVEQEARHTILSEIKLHDVTVGAALNTMMLASDHSLTFDFDESGQVGFIGSQRHWHTNDSVTVMNLKKVLFDHTHESFLSAVEIGLEMLGNPNSNIQMKLHEETSILFVKGSDEELALIEQIIEQIVGETPVEDITANLPLGGGFGGRRGGNNAGGPGEAAGGGGAPSGNDDNRN